MISFVGYNSAAATSVSLSGLGLAAGDYIVVFAYRNTTTAPSLITGYTNIANGSGNSNAYRVMYKVATGSETTTGAATNATIVHAGIYRGVASIGNSAAATHAASSTLTIPSMTLNNTLGRSWVVQAGGSIQTTSQGNFSSYTTRGTKVGTTSDSIFGDTNGGVTSYAGNSSANGASATYSYASVELIATNNAPNAPTLSSPSNAGTVTSTTPTLSFTDTDTDGDTLSYEVQVSTTASFTGATITRDSANEPSTNPTTSTGNFTTTRTSGSFTPQAHSAIFVVVGVASAGTSPPTATIQDSVGNTYTQLAQNSGVNSNLIGVYWRYYASSPGSITISATAANTSTGGMFEVLNYLGVSSTQTGNTVTVNRTTSSTGTIQGSLTVGVGNIVIGGGTDWSSSNALTPLANTTSVGGFQDTTNGDYYGAFTSTTTGTNTYGYSTSTAGGLAAVEIQAALATAPTLIGTSGNNWTSRPGTTQTTGSLSWQTGDLIVILGLTEDNQYSISTPTATGLTFSAVSGFPTTTAGTCKGYAWQATAASNGSGTISATVDNLRMCNIQAFVYRGSSGIGTTYAIASSGDTTTTANLARSLSNSAVVWGGADWGATNDTTVSSSPAGGTQQEAAFISGVATMFCFNWDDQGAAGTTAYGISGFTPSNTFTKIALEIKGTASSNIQIDALSSSSAGFADITNPADTDPFASGDTIGYTVQAGNALANSSTYYWRTRAIDPTGSNTWSSWSSTFSFTVNLSTATQANFFYLFADLL